MSEPTTTVNGETFILRDGRWQAPTLKEQAALDRPTRQVIGDAAATGASDLANLASMVVPSLRPGARLLDQVTQGAQERTADAETVRPYATGFGQGLPGGALELTGGGAAALAARRAARMAPNVDTVADLGGMVQSFGADSAGAASRGGFYNAARKMPKFKGMLDSLAEFTGANRPMTADQLRYVNNGDVKRVGIELMPGQQNGNNIITEIMMRDPLMADAFDGITSRNSHRLLTKASRALGLQPGDYGRDIRQLGRDSVGAMFKDVENQIGPVRLSDELAEIIGGTMTKQETEALDLTQAISGADVMDVRRYLADSLAGAMSDPALNVQRRQLTQAMDELDDLIGKSMTDPAAQQLWAEARSRWRVVRAFDRQGVVQPDGSISVKTLVNALDKEFEREFRRTSLTRGDRLPADVVEFLDYARVARSFMSNLNDSGTGTTLSLLQSLNSPMQFAKKRLAAKFIADVVVNDPYRAAAMPGDEVIEAASKTK